MNDESKTNAKEVQINVEPSPHGIVTILHGKALDPQPMKGLDISGGIEAPANFWTNRGKEQNKLKCFVERSNDTIKLTLNEDEPYIGGQVVGKIKLDDECSRFGINTVAIYTSEDLARLIKRNEFLFVDRKQWLTIYNSLVGFKATVEINITDIKEASGDREKATKITVTKTVETSFKLRTRIYGRERVDYTVDLNGEVIGHKVNFYLDSSDLAFIMSESKEKAMDENVKIFHDEEVLVIDK